MLRTTYRLTALSFGTMAAEDSQRTRFTCPRRTPVEVPGLAAAAAPPPQPPPQPPPAPPMGNLRPPRRAVPVGAGPPPTAPDDADGGLLAAMSAAAGVLAGLVGEMRPAHGHLAEGRVDAMVARVLEVLPHADERLVRADLMRTRDAALTINRLLEAM